MRKSHYYLFGVAIATFGFVTAVPGAASSLQDDGGSNVEPMAQPEPDMPKPDLSADQTAQFDNWPAQQKNQYELWPAETKAYYWTLNAERQELFWRLSDQDKIALTAMTGPERENAWLNIKGRAAVPPQES